MDASFIIVASGKGTRMGGTPKQFCRLGSMPMWRWSAFVANALFLEGIVGECVLVIPEGKTMTSDVDCFEMPLRFAPGGMERADSVLSGLRDASGEMVLVHDAARPLFRPISAGAFSRRRRRRRCSVLLRRTRSSAYGGGEVMPFPGKAFQNTNSAGLSRHLLLVSSSGRRAGKG
jgi:2-C-methyl-D-erythritol 4-phosphate cytidylyltransferase/2-C-methyl-D-erythritol 2,4-cyclodiphosphate synthase